MNGEGETDSLTHKIIGAAIEVHRSLGPGLLEELYEDAFCIELQERKLSHERQRKVNVAYKVKISAICTPISLWKTPSS